MAMLLLGLVGAGAGCSGINASHSISPASFFLPGLIQATPPAQPAEAPLPAVEPAPIVAQVR